VSLAGEGNSTGSGLPWSAPVEAGLASCMHAVSGFSQIGLADRGIICLTLKGFPRGPTDEVFHPAEGTPYVQNRPLGCVLECAQNPSAAIIVL
jgi:hypothetical protein